MRIELASALLRDIPVVPVLVQGAKMPQADQLPDDLKDLAYRNALELTHVRWKSDVQVLIQALRPHMDVPFADCSAGAKETARPGGEISRRQPDGRDVAALASTVDAQTMEHIRKELAAFIGPISEVVVKRAARRCASVEELCGMVALEIEAEVDRAKFLRSCRS